MAAVINTPTVAMTTMVIQTRFSTLQAQRRAAVEQDVAGAEQQDDLVQCRVRLDVDEAERLRTDSDAGDQEHRDVGNPDLLRQQSASVPIARISPQDSSVCLAISIEADASNDVLTCWAG